MSGSPVSAIAIRRAAARATATLAGMGRPAPGFDASRYFRGTPNLGFYNVGTPRVRALARAIHAEHRTTWQVQDAVAFADILIADRHLEAKGLALEVLGRYRRQFTPALLPVCKRWLARNHGDNWATTDAMCSLVIRPLLAQHPRLIATVAGWRTHRNMWVRRASAVALVGPASRGEALDHAYRVARHLHADDEDLIQKAVGWLLREAGVTDPDRLERYLRANGTRIPRTTIRYAIERFPAAKRRDLLAATRA